MVFGFLKIVKKLKLSIINSNLCLLKKILMPPCQILVKVFHPCPTFNGIEKLLTDLNPNKATGPDNIPGRILKMGAHEVAPALVTIFRKSLESGSLPDDWRRANVSPICKKGECTKPSNYRPVSLTFISCKVMPGTHYSFKYNAPSRQV